jgi:hypothetical protein
MGPGAVSCGPGPPSACGLFDGGPPLRIQTWLGLVEPGEPHVLRRAVLAALIGWLPLAALSAVQSLILRQDALWPFASDFGLHARSLITAPVLILAEAFLVPRLGGIAQHFLDAGLVTEPDLPRFRAAQASTLRLRDSAVAEVLAIGLAYAIVVAALASVPPAEVPAWQKGVGPTPVFSLAGWWHALVSLPLLVVLFLGWVWRAFLWTRFLWLMSRLDLRLIPAHPDHTAGLLFVGYSVRACGVLGFALGATVAGTAANGVVLLDFSLLAYRYHIAALIVFVVALFGGPLLVFTGRLLREWRRGVFEYGALADGLGRRFETRWFHHEVGEDVLQAPDFSAATDLYSVVANVYAMRVVPVERKSVFLLVIMTLAPFLPVLLMAVPLDTLFSDLANLLF